MVHAWQPVQRVSSSETVSVLSRTYLWRLVVLTLTENLEEQDHHDLVLHGHYVGPHPLRGRGRVAGHNVHAEHDHYKLVDFGFLPKREHHVRGDFQLDGM